MTRRPSASHLTAYVGSCEIAVVVCARRSYTPTADIRPALVLRRPAKRVPSGDQEGGLQNRPSITTFGNSVAVPFVDATGAVNRCCDESSVKATRSPFGDTFVKTA